MCDFCLWKNVLVLDKDAKNMYRNMYNMMENYFCGKEKFYNGRKTNPAFHKIFFLDIRKTGAIIMICYKI